MHICMFVHKSDHTFGCVFTRIFTRMPVHTHARVLKKFCAPWPYMQRTHWSACTQRNGCIPSGRRHESWHGRTQGLCERPPFYTCKRNSAGEDKHRQKNWSLPTLPHHFLVARAVGNLCAYMCAYSRCSCAECMHTWVYVHHTICNALWQTYTHTWVSKACLINCGS